MSDDSRPAYCTRHEARSNPPGMEVHDSEPACPHADRKARRSGWVRQIPSPPRDARDHALVPHELIDWPTLAEKHHRNPVPRVVDVSCDVPHNLRYSGRSSAAVSKDVKHLLHLSQGLCSAAGA